MTRRSNSLRHISLASLTFGLLAAAAAAHEDDPKILHRRPPVQGSGFQAGLPAGARLPGGGMNSSHQLRGNFDSDGVVLRSWLTLADLGSPNIHTGNDCWGYVSPSGREYAIMCTSNDTVFVEITNPDVPVIVGNIDGPDSFWRDAKVFQDRCYIVSEGGGGLQVVDMSNIDAGVVVLETSVLTGGVASTHNLALDEVSGFAYRCGGGGLRVYDLSVPSQPNFLGMWTERYVHDAQVVTYTTGPFAGRQIAFCCTNLSGIEALTLIDVTDKVNMVALSHTLYPNSGFSHQGWLSEDRRYYYLGDEFDTAGTTSTRTQIFDVADILAPSYVGEFFSNELSEGHNMYSKGGLLFQANYTSGLRVFDYVTDPLAPTEVAYFDTSNVTGNGFNGLWSCFPYFPSGTVIGSDVERGLFVLRLDDATIDIQVVGGPPESLDPNGATVQITMAEGAPGDVVLGSETLWYDSGAGFSAVPLVATAPGSYTATFPAMACNVVVDWYVSANTPAGTLVTAPREGASLPFRSVTALGVIATLFEPMDTDAGWVGGQPGDTATTGQWVRGDPIGTDAQPEDDHTPVGTDCWFTGQGALGGTIGDADVDNGATTLLSARLDVSGFVSPTISYRRWYSNDRGGAPNTDTLAVDISGDDGVTWTALERVGPDGPETAGGWVGAQFRVSDFITPTNRVRVRFVASDLGAGSIVEAAIDDFAVIQFDCDPIGLSYCAANPNSSTLVAAIEGSGSNVLANNDLVLTARDVTPNANGYFFAARAQAFVPNPGGSAGNLCVGAPTGRYIAQLGNSGAAGTLTLVVDNTAMPQPNGNVAAQVGETWYFQAWFRDTLLGLPTSNLSRGYAVTFE